MSSSKKSIWQGLADSGEAPLVRQGGGPGPTDAVRNQTDPRLGRKPNRLSFWERGMGLIGSGECRPDWNFQATRLGGVTPSPTLCRAVSNGSRHGANCSWTSAGTAVSSNGERSTPRPLRRLGTWSRRHPCEPNQSLLPTGCNLRESRTRRCTFAAQAFATTSAISRMSNQLFGFIGGNEVGGG
jgi:hypothetical protein